MNFNDFREIVVIDDDKIGAEISCTAVENLGKPVKLINKGKFTHVDQLLAKIFENTSHEIGVVCDHQLMNGALADFYGSELVAGLYRQKIPAILVTQYIEKDIDTSIRRFRRWTPALLRRGQLVDEDNVRMAFDFCNAELFGPTPTSRIPYRTLVEIISTAKDDETGVVEAVVHGWNPNETVGFPMLLMPDSIREQVTKTISKGESAFVFAEVNIGASRSSELYFDSFEWAEKPQGLTLDSLFNNH